MSRADDIPNTLHAARIRTSEQIQQLGKAADVEGDNPKGVLKESAILNALSARELSVANAHAAEHLGVQLEFLRNKIESSTTAVTDAIDRFAIAANASAAGMETWNRVIGVANVALALFALAQIAVAIIGLFSSPQIIVIQSPRF